MMSLLLDIFDTFRNTLDDVAPIIGTLFFFQYVVLKKPLANLDRILIGLFMVVLGLTLFLVGLKEAIFPLGDAMARQLTNPAFLYEPGQTPTYLWNDYFWVYIFGFSIGFATTVAEPALIAVSIKAEEISGGAISAFGLRMAVATGVAIGVSIGCFRIVSGTSLWTYIVVAYVVVLLQTMMAPKMIVPLAFDSGGVTTSTVTVPLLAALGLGLASTVPGRSPVIDGFGLIAFASVFPIMAVLAYAQFSAWLIRRQK
ncbi:DUF1538 domain-containing protein [Mariprofundus ferrooxydans]|uniref:Hypothetical PTS system mannose-specific, factor IIC n=1 Tax=Mariprofundus ferrooxydans PV-1 TaxID=314345 RepID=Q0F245_9PROT|nr:DUF1538 domain-containing protein [Mariprofundus ferrooxydans]EAU55705.1 hypothetical PTS system mannose-specific, factor IIC [Mariprofundus ferrooxydans PV-1]KON47869.1 hypothetical protein AL013_05140 [Mariprofundus ferrooxydans]